MNYNNYNRKKGTFVIKAVCALLFCIFSFVYLYFYQADILAVTQHVLSGGVTTYNRLIGAVLITVCLMLLQIGVASVIGLHGKYNAFTYFPSALLLALLSGMGPDIIHGLSLNKGIGKSVCLLLLWAGGCCVIKRAQCASDSFESTTLFSAAVWKNVLLMAVLFFFIGLAGNSDTVFHYRMRVEACLQKKDYDGALGVGDRSHDTDRNLTMLRIYALARTGKLGEKLFTYPVAGTVGDIVPMAAGTQCLLYPNDSIYRFLGARPVGSVRVMPYLMALQRTGMATDAVKDYILCGYLIDRNLDAFVRVLPRFYDIDDKLPTHYREALTLYTHLRANPFIVYHNDVMDTDYEDLQKLEKACLTDNSRKHAVHDQYAGTYWWYYEYGK